MTNTDLIALGSILISIIALVFTWLTDRKVKAQQVIINEYDLNRKKSEIIESKKAIVEANAFKSGNNWKIKIYNKGKATAKNIRIVSPDLIGDNGINLNIKKDFFPYQMLHPQTSFEIDIMLFSRYKKSPKVKFIWDDDSGLNQEREQLLDL